MNICFFGLFLITLNQTRVPGFPPSILTIFTNFHCGQSEIKHGLRSNCGLSIKHGLGIKCGPQTTLVKTVLIGSR